MTIREWFAGQCIMRVGWLCATSDFPTQDAAKLAVDMADALLAELAKPVEPEHPAVEVPSACVAHPPQAAGSEICVEEIPGAEGVKICGKPSVRNAEGKFIGLCESCMPF